MFVRTVIPTRFYRLLLFRKYLSHKSFIRKIKLIRFLINLLNWNDLLYIIMSEN